ncbi:MAG: glycerol-3-phosphate 1-O-acyltransferase PlsY [Vigna little leaf phytoplasma]|nr:glycerol-3-phosphate 1-O-acyltransferase PlsY [Vigna little leaf phytoplasma]
MENVINYHNVKIFIVVFLVYLFGSIPFGLLIGKHFKKIDLRLKGSRNIGTSNAIRILGWKYGLLIFILDFLKGFLSILILDLSFFSTLDIKKYRIFFIIAPILGHIFSIFHKFKGGKAIATSVGVITAINPIIGPLGILFFIIFFLWKGYASLASLIATLLVNIFLIIWYLLSPKSLFTLSPNELIVIFVMTIIIFIKHRNNIINLIKGVENKLR